MSEPFDFGREAEEFACQWLIQKGYKILDRNWFFDRAEIDIIAQHKDLLVIVEVKARKSDKLEFPEAAVNYKKRRHIVKATDAYIFKNTINLETRFDIIALVKAKNQWYIEHFKDAFLAFE